MNMHLFTAASLLAISAMLPSISSAETVTTLPTGITAELYSRDATATRRWGSTDTKQEWETGIATEIATSADGKNIYIKNAVGNYTEGYLVGTVNGNDVTFTFPQTITSQESTFTVACMIRNPEIDSKYVFIPDPDNQTVTFRFEGDRLILLSEGALLGLLNSEMNWSGKILSNITYKKVDITEVIPPAGLEMFNISLASDLDTSNKAPYPQYRLLSGCSDSSTLYIQGIDTSLPDKWVKIEIDGETATVKGGQFIGVSGERTLFFCAVIDTPEWNAGYQVWEHNFSLIDSYQMAYDEKAKKLTPLNPNNALCVNPGDEEYNYGMVYLNASLTEQPLEISLIPRSPFMDEDDDIHFFKNGAEPELMFQLLPLNEYGQLLDTKHFGYMVFQNNEPYVFNGFDYWLDDEEDITFIPWLFQSPFIYSSDNGTQFISFQESFITGITVRAVYRDDDGKEYMSAPLDPLNPTTSVSQVNADRQVAAEEFYNLNGIRVGSDVSGMIVKCIIYTDGSKEYRKIIR